MELHCSSIFYRPAEVTQLDMYSHLWITTLLRALYCLHTFLNPVGAGLGRIYFHLMSLYKVFLHVKSAALFATVL